MGTFEELGITYEAVSSLIILFIAAVVVSAVLIIALNTLKAAAVCEISYKKGLKNPWFSFVPVFGGFAFGRLASKKGNEETSVLGVMLGIVDFVYIASLIVACSIFLLGGAELIFAADMALAAGDKIDAVSFDMLSKMLFPIFLGGIVAVIRKVLYTVCSYKIFSDVSKNNAVLFTVLSFIIPVLLPFFLFAVKGNTVHRKSDEDEMISGFDIEG